MPSRLVGDASDRETPGVPDGWAEVDRVGGVRQVFALHDEDPHALTQVRVAHGLSVVPPPGHVASLHGGMAATGMLDQSAADPGQSTLGGCGPGGIVLHHGVVVHVGHGASLVRVQSEIGEVADHDRLEVHHEVTAQSRVVQSRHQKEPGVSMAPPATMTILASIDRSTPSAPM